MPSVSANANVATVMAGKPTSYREEQSHSSTLPRTGSDGMPSTSQLNIIDEFEPNSETNTAAQLPQICDFTDSHVSESNITVWQLKLLFIFLFETFNYNLLRLFQVSNGEMLTCFQIEEAEETTYGTVQLFTIIYMLHSKTLTFENIKYFYWLYDAVYHKLENKPIRNFIVFINTGWNLKGSDIINFGMKMEQKKESRILGTMLFKEGVTEVYRFNKCRNFSIESLRYHNSRTAPSNERVEEFFEKLLIYNLDNRDWGDIIPYMRRTKYDHIDKITEPLIEKGVQELVIYASSKQTQNERNKLSEALRNMLLSSSSPSSSPSSAL